MEYSTSRFKLREFCETPESSTTGFTHAGFKKTCFLCYCCLVCLSLLSVRSSQEGVYVFNRNNQQSAGQFHSALQVLNCLDPSAQRGTSTCIAQDRSIEQICRAVGKHRFAATKRISASEFILAIYNLRTMKDTLLKRCLF